MYPGKGMALFENWKNFKEHIKVLYASNLKSDVYNSDEILSAGK